MTHSKFDEFWVGITNRGTNGTWRFVTDNTTFNSDTSYFKWNGFHPDRGSKDGHCVGMHGEDLHKLDCSEKNHGMCYVKTLY